MREPASTRGLVHGRVAKPRDLPLHLGILDGSCMQHHAMVAVKLTRNLHVTIWLANSWHTGI